MFDGLLANAAAAPGIAVLIIVVTLISIFAATMPPGGSNDE